MLNPHLIQRYKDVSQQCSHWITGHPRLTMSEQLAEVQRLAGHYDQQDVYGTGEVIESFQRDIADQLGKPAAIFLVSGTMAQAIALRVWAERAGIRRVGFHHTSHLQLHEHNAYRELHGLDGELLGDPQRVVSLDDLAAAGPLGAALLELPMREIGGQLPDWDDLCAQSGWAKETGTALHMDGARLWQCTPYYGRSMAEISALFDSIYVSFYKDIGGIAGSVLAGPEDFIEEAKTWIARAGGNLYSLFPYVLAARAGMARNLHSMPAAVASARWLSEVFNEQLGLATTPVQPPTNLFHLVLQADPNELLEHAIRWSEENRVFIMPAPRPREDGSCVLEFSLGQAIQAQETEAWEAQLKDFYGRIPL